MDYVHRRIKDYVGLANSEAYKLGDMHINTAHLLLALLRRGRGRAGIVLEKLNINRKRAIREIYNSSVKSDEFKPNKIQPLTPRAKVILQHAQEELKKDSQSMDCGLAILRAIVNYPECMGHTILNKYGINKKALEQLGKQQ